MRRNVVLLNSGGFDSTVLLHDLHFREHNIISVFFAYGQRNEAQERISAQKNCEKLGVKHLEIVIPQFSWSKSTLIQGEGVDEATTYLEYRNLIFLAYAESLAETFKCNHIAMAIVHNMNGNFVDTSPKFIRAFDHFSTKIAGVKFYTPYALFEKEELYPIAQRYGITHSDFFSCNTPENGRPCGICSDCVALNEYKPQSGGIPLSKSRFF